MPYTLSDSGEGEKRKPGATSIAPGVVTNNCDLIMQGKVQVRIPSMGLDVWARVLSTGRPARVESYDLAIVEVDPVPFVEPGPTELDRLAYRLWLLRRQELKAHYERLGVAVGTWSDEDPFGSNSLEAALEGVRGYRRHARLARG